MTTTLYKIYDKTCDVCQMMASIDEDISEEYGLFFRKMELSECAKNPSHIRDYVVDVYVNPGDGTVDLPIYLITTARGEIQASGVIQNVEQLTNLIQSWKTWDLSTKEQ